MLFGMIFTFLTPCSLRGLIILLVYQHISFFFISFSFLLFPLLSWYNLAPTLLGILSL